MKRAFATLALSILALTASAEEKRLDKPRDLSGVKVIGTIQYGVRPKAQPATKATKTERPIVGYRIAPAPVKRVISSNELMKMTCVNGTCYDYVPAHANPFFQPGPDAPVQQPSMTVTVGPIRK